MKRAFERTRNLDQAASSSHVDIAILLQYSQHDSIRAEVFGGKHILLHSFVLSSAVAEVSAAWPDHDKEIDRKPAAHRRNQSCTRANPAFQQVATQLDAIRAASLRCYSRFDRIR